MFNIDGKETLTLEDVQNYYEDTLSRVWHKMAQLGELIDTNKNNSQLRLKSIKDRRTELDLALKEKEAFELLFEDSIVEPKWFKERYEEYYREDLL